MLGGLAPGTLFSSGILALYPNNNPPPALMGHFPIGLEIVLFAILGDLNRGACFASRPGYLVFLLDAIGGSGLIRRIMEGS